MRVLIIADEVWNDELYGNNVLSNWFNGFDAEFAEIYCGPGVPLNKVCTKYFQITDTMMAKSLVTFQRAGMAFETTFSQMESGSIGSVEIPNKRLYSFMKKIANEPIRFLRDMIWLTGRYNKQGLQSFIEDFNPQIIFSTRLLTPKLMRLEKIISRYTSAPIIAFTADDEASLKQVSFSPLFWIRRISFNIAFKNHIKLYSAYTMFSSEQALEYREKYHIETSVLLKAGNFSKEQIKQQTNMPIKLIYAGRLYCDRWKILGEISKCIDKINVSEIKMTLEIYTQDTVTPQQRIALHNGRSAFLKGSISPDKLKEIYNESDIALHVEAFDKKNMLKTRYSFSTKIIDCLASSCAVLAIAPHNQAGLAYLRKNDAAICISNPGSIFETLSSILNNPEIIREYSEKATNCGLNSHSQKEIQNQIRQLFQTEIQRHN